MAKLDDTVDFVPNPDHVYLIEDNSGRSKWVEFHREAANAVCEKLNKPHRQSMFFVHKVPTGERFEARGSE